MLQAIEDDRLDKLPQGQFVRGFVREYARFLALDEQKILNELSFHAPPPTVIDDTVGERGRRVSNRLASRLINGTLATVMLAGVSVLILSPRFSQKEATPILPAVDAPSSPGSNTQSNGAPTALHASPGTLTSGVSSVIPSASVIPQPPQPLQLTLTATEDCWIGLDVGGDRVENRILKKGESFSITARQNASLAVGNAGGLLVAIDSGPPRPLGNRGEVKRNIPLSPEAIGALSAGASAPPVKPIG